MILLIIGMNFLPLRPLPILIALFSKCCYVYLSICCPKYIAMATPPRLSITSRNPFERSYLGWGIDEPCKWISWMAFLLVFFTFSFVIPCYNCLQYINKKFMLKIENSNSAVLKATAHSNQSPWSDDSEDIRVVNMSSLQSSLSNNANFVYEESKSFSVLSGVLIPSHDTVCILNIKNWTWITIVAANRLISKLF